MIFEFFRKIALTSARAARIGSLPPEIFQSKPQALVEIDPWFPTKDAACFRDIWTALLEIVLRQRAEGNRIDCASQRSNSVDEFQDCNFLRVSDIHRFVLARFQKTVNSFSDPSAQIIISDLGRFFR